jgi:hypothetical protein
LRLADRGKGTWRKWVEPCSVLVLTRKHVNSGKAISAVEQTLEYAFAGAALCRPILLKDSAVGFEVRTDSLSGNVGNQLSVYAA